MPERVWEIMKIGFTGPFCDNNFGDYAMLINNIMDIDNAYGDSVEEYVVFCYNISFIDAVVSHYLPDIPLRTVEVELELEKEIVSAQPRISGNSKNFEIIYSDADLSVQGLMDATQNMKEISEIVHGIDILILSGGGCFNYYWLAKHRKARLFKMLIPLLAARSCGKRIVTMGNTFGPWGNENNKGFFREILRAVDFDLICVRDAVDSRKQLNALGVNDNKIRDIADDIYFLNARLKQKHQLLSEKYIIFETYHSMEELEKTTDG